MRPRSLAELEGLIVVSIYMLASYLSVRGSDTIDGRIGIVQLLLPIFGASLSRVRLL
jgi:hypothetical protein